MQKNPNDIAIFLLVIIGIILSMVTFIVVMLFLYRKRQHTFETRIEEMKQGYEKIILTSKLEVQEQTFHHISREIHDNINLSLTLAKLQLNTLEWNDHLNSQAKINLSIELLTESIKQLSNISQSLNSDIIAHQGLIGAIQNEITKISQIGLFTIDFLIKGNPIYLDSKKEIIIFRIIQEAFNNIIKHANATKTHLILNYTGSELLVSLKDNGVGFDADRCKDKNQAGLGNMESRVKTLNGAFNIDSDNKNGTSVFFKIPLN